ncbi:MAG: tetratricopeptide repeat protein [Tepidisphaeraceae bacterium]
MEAIGYRWPAFYIGDLLIAQGKTDEGLAVFKDLEALESRVGKRSGSLFGQIRTKHGDVLMRRLKGPVQADGMSEEDRATLSDAIEQYDQATVVAPDYLPPKLKLARIMKDIGRYAEAFVQIQDTLRIDPQNPDAMFMTAQIASSQNYYEPAAQQLVKLLTLEPRYLPAHLELARVMNLGGQKEAAIDELNRTLVLFPNHPQVLAMLGELTGRPTTQPATQAATQPGPVSTTAPTADPAR